MATWQMFATYQESYTCAIDSTTAERTVHMHTSSYKYATKLAVVGGSGGVVRVSHPVGALCSVSAALASFGKSSILNLIVQLHSELYNCASNLAVVSGSGGVAEGGEGKQVWHEYPRFTERLRSIEDLTLIPKMVGSGGVAEGGEGKELSLYEIQRISTFHEMTTWRTFATYYHTNIDKLATGGSDEAAEGGEGKEVWHEHPRFTERQLGEYSQFTITRMFTTGLTITLTITRIFTTWWVAAARWPRVGRGRRCLAWWRWTSALLCSTPRRCAPPWTLI